MPPKRSLDAAAVHLTQRHIIAGMGGGCAAEERLSGIRAERSFV
jgi:hypothetical protein